MNVIRENQPSYIYRFLVIANSETDISRRRIALHVFMVA